MKRKPKIDLQSKSAKYFFARQKTKTKKEACDIVGVLPQNARDLEATETYQELTKIYFKDVLLKQITMPQIASELLKNIVQDTDRGAKNQAIKIALDKLEPNGETGNGEDERVFVVIK